jgi:hypothetical protein
MLAQLRPQLEADWARFCRSVSGRSEPDIRAAATTARLAHLNSDLLDGLLTPGTVAALSRGEPVPLNLR